MRGHRPEVADVIREYGSTYLKTYGSSTKTGQKRVLKDICLCRTAALGGHKERCDICGHEVISYNSCRNRHCPKCQGAARAEWLDARAADLLEVPYFHVVFTLPEKLGHLALQNKCRIYGILFQAASQTLLTIAQDPKHLGAKIGFLMVLHTWGQTLTHHPHVHAVVPGGGLSVDGSRWVSCREGFFLPVRVLSVLFRKKFLSLLTEAFHAGELSLHGQLKSLSHPGRWNDLIENLEETDWVVYAKPPFGGPEQVLKYLARYSHRVAISNSRLVSVHDGKVTFRWKDYTQQSRQRTMTIATVDFIRRFLLHVLPKGFVRIRHYGFLANRIRKEKLALCRRLLCAVETKHVSNDEAGGKTANEQDHYETAQRCPVCGEGRLIHVEAIKPQRMRGEEILFYLAFDTL